MVAEASHRLRDDALAFFREPGLPEVVAAIMRPKQHRPLSDFIG